MLPLRSHSRLHVRMLYRASLARAQHVALHISPLHITSCSLRFILGVPSWIWSRVMWLDSITCTRLGCAFTQCKFICSLYSVCADKDDQNKQTLLSFVLALHSQAKSRPKQTLFLARALTVEHLSQSITPSCASIRDSCTVNGSANCIARKMRITMVSIIYTPPKSIIQHTDNNHSHAVKLTHEIQTRSSLPYKYIWPKLGSST